MKTNLHGLTKMKQCVYLNAYLNLPFLNMERDPLFGRDEKRQRRRTWRLAFWFFLLAGGLVVAAIVVPIVLESRQVTSVPGTTTTSTSTSGTTTLGTTTTGTSTSGTSTSGTTTSGTTTTGTSTLGTSTSGTSTTDTTTLGTSTTGPTTTPSAMSITCPGPILGELELNDFTSPVIGNYTVLNPGALCGGGSNVTLELIGASSVNLRRYARRQLHPRTGSLEDAEYNYTAVEAANYTAMMNGFYSTNATEVEEMILQKYSGSVTLDYSSIGQSAYSLPSQTRDFQHPTPALLRLSSFPRRGSTTPFPVESEAYASGDASSLGWKISIGVNGLYDGATEDPVGNIGFFSYATVIPPACQGVDLTEPVAVVMRYNHARGQFVILTLRNATTTMCLIISNTGSPLDGWNAYTFVDARFTHLRGLSMAMWGEYYTVSWLDAGEAPRTAIFLQSSFTGAMPMPQVALFDTFHPVPGSGYQVPPFYPLHQSYFKSTGQLLTTNAPCGVFAMLDDFGGGNLRFYLCQGLNFSAPMPSGTATFTEVVLPVSGGWTSGFNQICDNYGQGCIDSAGSGLLFPAYSTFLRTAYHLNADTGEENIAFVFINNPATVSTLKWGEIPRTNLFALAPVAPHSVAASTSEFSASADIFAPGIAYDCRETLHISATVPWTAKVFTQTMYRLRTDPVGSLRVLASTVLFDQLLDGELFGNAPNGGRWSMPMMGVDPIRPRRMIHTLDQVISTARHNLWSNVYVPRNQTTMLTVRATDTCGNTDTCTVSLELGTIAACNNTVPLFA
jgi:hypothetical protein